ncbi:protein of unknown function (plasmid) [Caballeronia sp. S22]
MLLNPSLTEAVVHGCHHATERFDVIPPSTVMIVPVV